MKDLLHVGAHIRTIYIHRHEPEYAIAFADFYWRGLLFTAAVVVIVVCAYSGWQFWNIVTELGTTATQSQSAPLPLNKTLLNNTMAGFEARSVRFNAVASLPTVADPYNP